MDYNNLTNMYGVIPIEFAKCVNYFQQMLWMYLNKQAKLIAGQGVKMTELPDGSVRISATGESGVISFRVGATVTTEPGTDANVINVGDDSEIVLEFYIPRGEKGDSIKGDQGEQGFSIYTETTPITGGTQITIRSTDPSVLDQTFNVMNGTNGSDGVTPHIDPTTGNWFIGSTDTGVHAQGEQGVPGQNGTNGTNGSDGVTPHIDPTTGNWFIGSTDTGVHAQGEQGVPGQNGTNGTNGSDGVTPHIDPTTGNWFIGSTDTGVHAQGEQGVPGQNGTNGTNGSDGVTPHIDSTTGNWFIGSTDTGVHAQGEQGVPGQNGTNGTNGSDGVTPHIDSTTGNWFIGSTDTGVHAQGEQGVPGQNGTNGTNGSDGVTPHIDSTTGNWFIGSTDTGVHAQGEQGVPGQNGTNGTNGSDGVTPHIDSTTGNWFIGSTDTGVHAQGPAGPAGSVAGDGVIYISLTPAGTIAATAGFLAKIDTTNKTVTLKKLVDVMFDNAMITVTSNLSDLSISTDGVISGVVSNNRIETYTIPSSITLDNETYTVTNAAAAANHWYNSNVTCYIKGGLNARQYSQTFSASLDALMAVSPYMTVSLNFYFASHRCYGVPPASAYTFTLPTALYILP